MRQITSDVVATSTGNPHSLVLTRRTDRLHRLAGALPTVSASRSSSADGMGARARAAVFVSSLASRPPATPASASPDAHRIDQDIPDR